MFGVLAAARIELHPIGTQNTVLSKKDQFLLESQSVIVRIVMVLDTCHAVHTQMTSTIVECKQIAALYGDWTALTANDGRLSIRHLEYQLYGRKLTLYSSLSSASALFSNLCEAALTIIGILQEESQEVLPLPIAMEKGSKTFQ